MSSSNNNSTSGGVGVTSLLGVAFIILKLCHVITWSWLWVLAPFWIPFTIAIPVILVLIIGAAIS